MKGMELFEELTELDDDLILNAHEQGAVRTCRPRLLVRIALIAAIVSLLVVSAMASGKSLPFELTEETIKDGIYEKWLDGKTIHYLETYTADVNGQDVVCYMETIHDPAYATAYVKFDSGEPIQITMFGLVFLPDGTSEVKRVAVQGEGTVRASMDNLIDGKPGTILTLYISYLELPRDVDLSVYDDPSAFRVNSLWYSYLGSWYRVHVPEGTNTVLPSMYWPDRTTLEGYQKD